MKNTSILKAIGIFVVFALTIFSVSAAQSFKIDGSSSVTQTKTIGQSGSGSFTIENTGDEGINLTVTNSNLVSGSNSVTLTPSPTSISNLVAAGTRDIDFSYTTSSSSSVGTYTATINVTNTDNSAQVQTYALTVVLTNSNATVEIVNEDDDTFEMRGEVDESVREDIRFRNTGETDLSNVSITISDLRGVDTGESIDNSDIDFDPDSFNLDKGDTEKVEIDVDIEDDIEPDTYSGTITFSADGSFSKEFTLELEVTADDLDVVIQPNSGDVRSGILEIIGESGEFVDDYEIIVDNDGNIDLSNLEFELDGDLEEEFTSNELASSAISFSPTTLDLDGKSDEKVEVRVQIPSTAVSGTYFADLKVLTSSGRELDKIAIKVRVIGDIFINTIEVPDTVDPNEILEVKVKVKNDEAKVQRDVKLSGTILDIDSINSDLTETSSTFLLDVKEEKEITLRFRIPEDATDGSHELELSLTYDNEEITEVKEIIVERPTLNIEVETFAINPAIVVCEDQMFTYTKLKNLGRFDEDVVITAEIVGTGLKRSTNTFDLDVDDVTQRNLIFDISSLNPGIYKVNQKVSYSGTFVESEAAFRVDECNTGTGVDIKPITVNSSETGNSSDGVNTTDSSDTLDLFGQEVEKTTVYLGSGVGVVVVVIVGLLFFL